MKEKKNRLLLVSSILILVLSLPFTIWCYFMINITSAKTNNPYAALGLMIAAIIYLCSIIIGIVGIIEYKKKKIMLSRIVALVGLSASIINIFFLREYVILTSLPLMIILIVYLFGTKEII